MGYSRQPTASAWKPESIFRGGCGRRKSSCRKRLLLCGLWRVSSFGFVRVAGWSG